MCLGTKLRKLINILTFGTGKKVAEKIANFLGYPDCGCGKREQYLNKLFGCKKDIFLF